MKFLKMRPPPRPQGKKNVIWPYFGAQVKLATGLNKLQKIANRLENFRNTILMQV